MSEYENLAAIEAFVLAYNEQRIDDAVDMLSSDVHLLELPHDVDLHGREAIRQRMRDALAMFPGRRQDIIHSLASGDHVVTEHHWTATRAGSGEHLTRDFCCIFRLADGLVAEWREYG